MGDAAEGSTPLLRHLLGLSRDSRALANASAYRAPLDSPKPLPDIPLGREVYLAANEVTGLLRQRLVDLGFTPGAALRLIRKGPKENLIAVSIRNTMIALRSEEARSLFVT